MDNKPTAFAEALRKTTREPLFVHPLIWDRPHLEAFRVSVTPQSCSKAQLVDQKKRLPTGAIDHNSLEKAWFWAPLDMSMVDYYLPSIIASVIDSSQKKCINKQLPVIFKRDPLSFETFKYFRKLRDAGPLEDQCCALAFYFASVSKNLLTEVLFSTDTRIPFLVYNGPAHRSQARYELSLKVRPQFWKILDDLGPARFSESIDPYDAACLIAMAQEQRIRLSLYAGLFDIDMYTVYLFTPSTTTVALELFTAHISKEYLDALENTNLEIVDKLVISKEIIDLPHGDPSMVDIGEGTLVDRIGEILEHAYDLHESAAKGYYEGRACDGAWSWKGVGK